MTEQHPEFLTGNFKSEPFVLDTTKLRTKATFDMFGDNGIKIAFKGDQPIPNRWVRFWTKLFFNSKWTLMEKDS